MTEKPKIETSFFHNRDLRMRYARWGSGSNVLIALHGFGRNYKDFIRFTRPLEGIFTVYAVDIFFHGESSTSRPEPDKNPLNVEEFSAFFAAFFDHIGAGRVWLMGYSLGGRLAMVLAQNMPERIGGLYLLAPDGLVVNRWYGMLSHYAAGRSLFRFLKQRPKGFFRSLKVLRKTGVVSDRTADFVRSQIESPADQERVYMVWCFLRKLEPDHKQLGECLSGNGITLDLFFGLYDNIIRVGQAKKLRKHFPKARVHQLRSGHFLLTAANGVLAKEEGMFQLPGRGV